jgi:streptomycin 6-kinase
MRSSNTFNLPQKFTRTISGMFAGKGEQWLAKLPEIVGGIAGEWSLTVAKPFANLSYHYVVECTCEDGSEAVLKIGFPEEKLEFFSEIKMLRLFDGAGAVRLLRASESNYAMLLEKLTPGEGLGEFCLKDDAKAVRIAAGILKKIVRKAPADSGFHLLKDWIGGFGKAENTQFPARIIKKARDFFSELTRDDKQKFLLHGDFHHENILSAAREPFLVIDPKGLIGWIGYDIGVFLNNHRNWLDGLPDRQEKLNDAVAQFAETFEIEEQSLRKWAFVQMVLSAWWTFEENGSWRGELSRAEEWQV